MKISTAIFIAGILAIGVVCATPLEEELNDSRLAGFICDLINKTINNILCNMSDPINVDNLGLNLTGNQFNGALLVDHLKLYGIKDLVAEKLDVSILTLILNATIKVPEINLNTKYFSDLTILELVPFYGNGRLSFTLDDTEIYICGKVNLNGGLSISNTTVSFNIGDGVFQVTGLLNDDDFSVLITTLCNDIIVEFINKHHHLISKIISPIAEVFINSMLGSKTNSELLEVQKLYEAEVAALTP